MPSQANRALSSLVALSAVLSCVLLSAPGCGPDPGWPDDWEPELAPDSDPFPVVAEPRSRLEPGDRSLSIDAKIETEALLRLDLESVAGPADGAGRAWLEEPRAPEGGRVEVVVGSRERFVIVFEAGPLGVEVGGTVFLQPSPFWGWDSPQVEYPTAPGYTEVASLAQGVELHAITLDRLLGIEIAGRKLEAGERIRIVFGAGPAKAGVDHYAERGSRIWIAVDGDGDTVRAVIPDSPILDVLPGSAAKIVLTLPTTARTGEPIRATLAVLDLLGNAGVPYAGKIELESPPGLGLPAEIVLEPEDRGHRTLKGLATVRGVYRVTARSAEGIAAESNPLVVSDETEPILWADLHGHSQLSDGTGTPEDYFRYARDISALDVVALTDHDHWGMRFIDSHPELWQRIREATAKLHEPGRFVTLLGYEWTSWLHGHRHVIYFSDEGDVLSSLDRRYETPAQLWAGLSGQPALTFAHHSAGGPVSTNWDFPPDPHFEPVTEIASVHGSSEAEDSPKRIYDPVRGNFIRDILPRGYQLGFIGSGDSHDGHPGLVQLAHGARNGGLAAIFAQERTRESVLEALRARRVYATNGPRILLRVDLDGHPMGSILDASEIASDRQDLTIRVASPGPLQQVDVIRGGTDLRTTLESIPLGGPREWSTRSSVPRLQPGDFLYVRVVQEDGGAAWSSPVYAR